MSALPGYLCQLSLQVRVLPDGPPSSFSLPGRADRAEQITVSGVRLNNRSTR